VGIIAPGSWLARIEQALKDHGIDYGRAQRGSLDHQVTVAPVNLIKGLELDACIVVEPTAILDNEHRGAQTLYVAVTRATRRLSLLAVTELPEILRPVQAAPACAPEHDGQMSFGDIGATGA